MGPNTRIIFSTFFLLFILLGGTSYAGQLHKPEPFQMATEEYPPFISEKFKHYGILNHIVTEAFRLEGVEVEYTFFPPARSFKMAETGKWDGTVPWAERADRENNFLYSDPILNVGREFFFFKKNFTLNWDPKIQNYDTLKGRRIGAIISYDYGDKFRIAEKKGVFTTTRVSSLSQLFSMLFAGRIDLIISKVWVAQYVLQSNFSSDQNKQIMSLAENEEPPSYDYVLISKKSPNAKFYLNAVNNGLKKLKESGKYDMFIKAFKNGDYLRSPQE